MRYFVGLDLGGTNIKAGLVDEQGGVVARLSVPTHSQEGPDAVVEALAEAAHLVVERGGLKMSEVQAIGVGSPGPVDYDHGVVLIAPNLPGFVNVPLRQRISALTGRPTFVENDANAAAMGEYWAGAAKNSGVRHLIMIMLGTGVGSGIVINGHIARGGSGMGGESGHIIVVPEGNPCGCGQRGCVEQYASATAIVRSVRAAIKLGESTGLRKLELNGDRQITAEDVFNAAKEGDDLAQRVISQMTDYLAIAAVTLCRVLDPQMIVFAGGMMLAGDYLFDRIRASFEKHNWRITAPNVRLVSAELGNDVGFIGAAAVAWDGLQLQAEAEPAGTQPAAPQ